MPDRATVDPEVLVAALQDAGWEVVGERAGAYKRLRLGGELHGQSLVVYLDKDAPEYPEMQQSALVELRRIADHGRRAQRVRDAIGEVDQDATQPTYLERQRSRPTHPT